ncbi:MAG: hypothetical protein GY856_00755, partial [bacterium]|nr:hypothetical protein [bacterium]
SRDSSDTSENAWTASGDISLSAFADQSVQVRFRFDSVDGTYNNFTGWLVDDVVVVADSPCVGNTAPTVNITAPADGSTYDDNDSITFTGTADDTEDGNITSSLSWSSSIDGAIGSGGSFSTTLSVGTHTITASVTDSGGLPGSDAITVYVNPANTAPTVTITAPADGSGYTAGDSITFTGTANDTEDGNITASLSWTSSIDGTIGSGGSFSTTTLSLGTHTITASVTDSGGLPGSDAITVYVNPAGDYLNFNDYPTVAYSTQDGSGSFEIQDGGLTFSMVGNRWRRTSATFEITPYTVLEFDFKSTSQGEIHAIGFDEDDTLTNDVRMFRVFGTQSWASDIDVADPYTTGDMGTYVHFTVRVGEYYTGSAMYLVLVNDKDSGTLDNTGWFTNVKIYEDPPTVDPLDFNVVTTSAYSNQDGTGTIDVQDGGLTFYMEGNRWRATDQTFNVTAGTVLSFDFKSTSEGEIHGLGFDEDHELSNNQRVFRIFGTQAWTGDIDWSDPYTSGDLGNWRTFTIPVGDYYTGSNMMLILVNDYDAGSGNTSWFRNVRIYEP